MEKMTTVTERSTKTGRQETHLALWVLATAPTQELGSANQTEVTWNALCSQNLLKLKNAMVKMTIVTDKSMRTGANKKAQAVR
jgi:hypothetical protein